MPGAGRGLSGRDVSDAERRAALEASVDAGIEYSDPEAHTAGIDELAAHISGFLATVPGAKFLNQQFLEHHDQAVASWELRDAAEALIARGISYVTWGERDRIVSIAGFVPDETSS